MYNLLHALITALTDLFFMMDKVAYLLVLFLNVHCCCLGLCLCH